MRKVGHINERIITHICAIMRILTHNCAIQNFKVCAYMRIFDDLRYAHIYAYMRILADGYRHMAVSVRHQKSGMRGNPRENRMESGVP